MLPLIIWTESIIQIEASVDVPNLMVRVRVVAAADPITKLINVPEAQSAVLTS